MKETAKEKAIREAYENIEYGYLYKGASENGWVDVKPGQFTSEVFDRLKFNNIKHSIRPKSLLGIEHNEGWIRIESESDLPTEEGQYFVYSKVDWHPFYRIDIFTGRLSNAIHHKTGEPIFTHYQPIEKPLNPIY